MPKRIVVKAGDCIDSLAFERGFFPDTIWDHPENASLKKLRRDPSVLAPGDVVFIPDKREKTVAIGTDARHVFRRRGVPKRIRVQALRVGKPLANKPYTLEVDGVRLDDGRTDAEGWIDRGIPPNAVRAVLALEGAGVYRLLLGMLDPVETEAGLRQRLRGLGLLRSEPARDAEAHLRAVLEAFQRTHQLEPTGEADEPTRARLRELAGA